LSVIFSTLAFATIYERQIAGIVPTLYEIFAHCIAGRNPIEAEMTKIGTKNVIQFLALLSPKL